MSQTGYTGFGGFPEQLIGGDATFTPLDVPEVVAGRWWDPQFFTNLGAAAFRWTEQTDVTTEFDGLQPTLARQPAQITTRGYQQWRFTGGSSVTATVGTAGPMGWTGATMIGQWIRFPSGLTATTQMLRHNPAGGQRRLQTNVTFVAAVPNFRFAVSPDGTALTEWRWPVNTSEGALFSVDLAQWHYYEWLYFAALRSDPLQRFALYLDRVLQTPVVTVAVGATIFDPVSSVIAFGGTNVAAPNAQASDVGMQYYCNGIPSDQDRQQLYQYKAPAP